MANATKYVDNVNGNNGNTGDSEVQAYADIPTAIAAISGGGNIIYVQAGANYTLTSTIALTGSLKGDTTNGRNVIEGYTTTPGSKDGRPVITSATNSVALFTLNDNDVWDFCHLNLTHTAATRGNAFVANTSPSAAVRFYDLVIDGCLNGIVGGTSNFSAISVYRCEIKNCTATAAGTIQSNGTFWRNYIHDNAGDGIALFYQTAIIDENIIVENGRYGIIDSTGAGSALGILSLQNNTIANNTSDGVRITTDTAPATFPNVFARNIIYGNGGYGINCTNLSTGENLALSIINESNAYGSNTSGARANLGAGFGEVTLTGDPFTNAGTGDWSLDNTASEGAACRGISFAYSGGTVTSYGDLGAVQHQDAGGGGGGGGPRFGPHGNGPSFSGRLAV
jgi:hypothetical protein